LASGCVTVRPVPLDSGSRLLVVADAPAGDDPASAEAELGRSLAVVPLRAWPSDAEPALAADLEGADRLEQAREAAEDRRLPWLLVFDRSGVRVEEVRSGDVVWRGGSKTTDPEAAALALRRGLGERGPLSTPRLAPPGRLADVRQLAAASRWEAYGAAVEALANEFPADPAARAHVGLTELLVSDVGRLDGLDLARQMAPESESELLAVALAAEAEGNIGLAVKARRALLRLHPDRIDYRTALADDLDLLDEADEALSVCRGGLALADRDAVEALPKGTAPHQAPDALVFADLSFCVGFHLFEVARWEQAALSYEDAAGLYEALGRWPELGETLNNAGVAMVQADRPLVGARALRQAVDVREELGYPLPLANSRYNLGRAYAEAGRAGQALITLNRASQDYRTAGEPLEALDTLVDTLELHVDQGDQEGFEERGRAILGDLEAEPESERRDEVAGNAWFELGRGRLTFGDPEGSLAAYLRSLRVWQALSWRLEEGQTHYSMALPHLAALELDEAWMDLVRALEISVELSDSSSILTIRDQLEDVAGLIRQTGQEPPELPEPLRRWLEPPGAAD